MIKATLKKWEPTNFTDINIPELVSELPVDKSVKASTITGGYKAAKERMDNFCKKHHFTPKVYTHVSGHEAMVALASLGFGIACVPEIVISQSPFKNQVQLLQLRSDEIEIGLVTKNKRLYDPVVKALWDTAKGLFTL